MSAIVDISEVILELGLSSSITEEERALIQSAITKSSGAIIRHLKYDPVQRVRTEYYPQIDFVQSSGGGVWETDGTNAYLRRVSQASTSELQVSHLPVRALDENGANAIDLRIDHDGRGGSQSGSFSSASQKVEGTDFWPNYDRNDSSGRAICSDGIIKSIGRWPNETGSIKIVYVAGYTVAELHGQDSIIDASPILDATIDEAVRRVQKSFSRQKSSKVGFTGGPFMSERLGDYNYKIDTTILANLVGGNWDILPETSEKLQEFVRMDLGIM